jgi:hypothetical protein
VNAWYQDGSNGSQVMGEDIILKSYTVLELLVGAGHLELSDTVVRWSVVLTDPENAAVSDTFEFVIDSKAYTQQRWFLFRNSFFAYELFRSTGITETTLEYDREQEDLAIEAEESSFNAPVTQFYARETQKVKASSGWVSKEMKNFLREFMLSNEIYEIIDGKFYPVVITSKKTSLFKDRDNNYALEFEYSRAYSDTSFTKI